MEHDAQSFRRRWLVPVAIMSLAAFAIFWGLYATDYLALGSSGGGAVRHYLRFDPASITDAVSSLAGLMAAVLGIVITMSHLDGGPEEIGHHVAAALVGTFLGILLCYGVVGPIANSIEMQSGGESRYMSCIKEAVVAAARGVNPAIAIEFARRSIFSDERPSGPELEKAFSELKGKA